MKMPVLDIPGMTFVGYCSTPKVMNGAELPLYESAPRADGRPDINTVEGWNLMRHDFAARALRKHLDREPEEVEIQTEMGRNAEDARRIVEQCSASREKLPTCWAECEDKL